MILFLISVLLVFVSSYLLSSVLFKKSSDFEKHNELGFLYLVLISFAQVVLTFEILSLFKAISILGVFALNFLFLIISFIFWKRSGKFLYKPQVLPVFKEIKEVLLKDKLLLVMSIGLIFFIFTALYLSVMSPVNLYDSLAYRVPRAIFWVVNGSLSHFDIPDARMLVMPINSEILYAWILLFMKSDWYLGLFSFLSYIVSAVALYNFTKEFEFPLEKRIWAIVIFSSLASIVIEASSTEIDLLLGALIFVSMYLFLLAAKKNCPVILYFSALSYALAIGTKTPAIMVIPSFILYGAAILYIYNRENIKSITGKFILFLVINFVLFASYNYILNLIHFGNPMGPASVLAYHSFYGGFKGFIGNIIRHLFLLIDFSGFEYAKLIGKHIVDFEYGLLDKLHIAKDYGVILSSDNTVNQELYDSCVGLGVLGILLFVPSLVLAFIRYFKEPKNTVNIIFAILAGMFFLNIIVLSLTVGFMVYSVRFITVFAILASPLLAFTYIKSSKNIFKWVVAFYVLSYFLVISTNIGVRPFFFLVRGIKSPSEMSFIRGVLQDSKIDTYPNLTQDAVARNIILSDPQIKNVAVIVHTTFKNYLIKAMEFQGVKVDYILLEDYDKCDISKYDAIITNKTFQDSDYMKYFPQRLKEYDFKNNTFYLKKWRKSFCSYTDRDGKIITDKDYRQSTFVVCSIPVRDFYIHGFKKIAEIGLAGDDTPTRRKTVVIYKNKRLMPK